MLRYSRVYSQTWLISGWISDTSTIKLIVQCNAQYQELFLIYIYTRSKYHYEITVTKFLFEFLIPKIEKIKRIPSIIDLS